MADIVDTSVEAQKHVGKAYSVVQAVGPKVAPGTVPASNVSYGSTFVGLVVVVGTRKVSPEGAARTRKRFERWSNMTSPSSCHTSRLRPARFLAHRNRRSPVHRNGGDAVLRRTIDDTVRVREVDQRVA